MKFLTATEIGRKLSCSYQKVNKNLALLGLYNLETKQPTIEAIEKGLAERRNGESKFSGESVDFTVWSYSKIVELLPEPTEEDERKYFKNRHDAYEKICLAFVDLGEILSISADSISADSNNDISADAKDAVIQSEFGDPDCLGGTAFWHNCIHKEESLSIKNSTLPLAEELFKKAEKIDGHRAKLNYLTIKEALLWLCKKTRG